MALSVDLGWNLYVRATNSSTMDEKTILGIVLLVASTATIFGLATLNTQVPLVLGAIGVLGMAAAALLIGTSVEGRPV